MAATNKTQLSKPGQYDLSELTILSYLEENSQPKRLDLRGILYNFEIAEDIMNNNVAGSIIVYDMNDIRTLFPITGLEKLSLKFGTPGTGSGYDFSEETGVPLQIYKLDKVTRDPTNDKGQFYQIFFCSPEMFRSATTKISRAYKGPIEEAIFDIVRNKLKSKKPFFFEPTATNAKYVIPNLKPYDAINYLCTQALPQYHRLSAGYKFYETSQGFYFRSIASMMSYGGDREIPHKWSFASLIASQTDYENQPERKDIERRMSNALKYEFTKPVDTLRNINEGFYANKLTVHDAFNKTIKTHVFNYFESGPYRPHTHMSKDAGLLMPQSTDFTGVPFDEQDILSGQEDSKTMVVTETSKVHNDYEFTPTKDTLPYITHDKAGFKNHNLSLLVFGNTQINAGDIILFTSPLLRPEGGDSPYTSGRYIVMAIKHVVNIEAQRHEMVLKCYKDSVRNEYPREEDAVFALGKSKEKGNFDIYREQRNEMAIEST